MIYDVPGSDKGIVFFDGYCILCNRIVALLIRIDKRKRLFFATFESKAWKEISESKPQDLNSIVYYVNGNQYLQSEAILKIIQTLGFPWKVAYIAKYVPYSLREKLYQAIARKRYLIFGRRETCMIPPKDIMSRYLT